MAAKEKIKRNQTVGEEIANSVSHGVMALFGVLALVLLILKADGPWEMLSAIVFGISIILLYAMSTLYHALAFTKSKSVFKRLDHLSIYILIGGTFAPALLLLPSLRDKYFLGIEGFLDTGLSLFIIQWIVITVGIVFKSIWVYRYQALHVIIFLILGWSALIFATDLFNQKPMAFILIFLGGLAYSVGVIFYAKSNIRYFHFLWHIWVAIGTILQFFAIYLYLI